MTWEETIKSIRLNPEFNQLVRDAYFDTDLRANVERFKSGNEFKETLSLIKSQRPHASFVADIGSGNGISSISFALEGYIVFSIEPDPSDTIGAGATRKLTVDYQVGSKVSVHDCYGEDTGLNDEQVDIVYIRQAMHHAKNLTAMMKECYRILKPGGLLITVRDHVIFDEQDKKRFLESHPLHKFYGGENAFTEKEYKGAMIQAGFRIERILKYYDSIINYFPLSKADIEALPLMKEKKLIGNLEKRIGRWSQIAIIQKLYKKYNRFSVDDVYDERKVPGRMYSFLAVKP